MSIQKAPRTPVNPAPTQGSMRNVAAALADRGSPERGIPIARDATVTPAPTPASTNDTVEMLASKWAESRVWEGAPGGHTNFGHSPLSDDLSDHDARPVATPTTSPAAATPIPA